MEAVFARVCVPSIVPLCLSAIGLTIVAQPVNVLEFGEAFDLGRDPDVGKVPHPTVLEGGPHLHPQGRSLQLLLGQGHLVVVPDRHLGLEGHAWLEDQGLGANEPQAKRLVDNSRLTEAPLGIVVKVFNHVSFGPDLKAIMKEDSA